MSSLEKIIYIADHTEPYRRYKGVKQLRKLSMIDRDRTIALISDKMIKYLRKNNIPVYDKSIKTRDYYLDK